MVYKYLLVYIHSSDLFFSVGFIYCVNFFKKKKALYSLFMDGIQLPQGYRATARRHFTFTTKLTSIAQRAINLNSDVLHNLVPFVQF